ncbi:preprotein translocase subunit SecD [Halobacteriales archaeon QS_1_68_20]|nr:MAG: preprotein translocase subunit SecD [Halobacteriales archaeon QS_1_68_20]
MSDGYYAKAKANWRVLLLTVFILMSTISLFVPAAVVSGGGVTNLEYGLDLDGGTRVRAPFVGMTAEGVDVGNANPSNLETQIAEDLGLSPADVQVRPSGQTVEVFSENVSESEFGAALESAGLEYDSIRSGVTEQTRTVARNTVEDKISESPQIPGGKVQMVTTPGGEHFLLIEAPGVTRDQVLDLIRERGVVEIVAIYPTGSGSNGTVANDTGREREFNVPEGYATETMFTQAELASVSSAREGQGTQDPHVPVSLRDGAAQDFESRMIELGFTNEGVGRCDWRADQSDPGYCLLTVVDGEVVYAANMGQGLADDMNAREYSKTGDFRLETTNISEARALRVNLQAGALPTDLDLDAGTSSYIEPSIAERFKFLSLLTGVLAALTVALVIYARYRNPKVSIPLFLTALTEVYILLGFAAAISLPLDLAHIAGFIAAIGTGVDDLVIIADEVMSQGDVKTRRVFRNRFRKAFWVIGAAAITTIIAMSPLTVLSLGDLSGFAIVTIVGVLVGVLITRPAYGDILRTLLTRE